MTVFVETRDFDLQPLDRGIDEAHRGAGIALLAQHVPGLDRLAQLELDAAVMYGAAQRKTKLPLRLEPDRIEGVAGGFEIVQDVAKILPDEMLEHEAVVQRGAPTHRLAVERRAPEPGDNRAQQQLLSKTHACIGRHLERAEFDKSQPAGRA